MRGLPGYLVRTGTGRVTVAAAGGAVTCRVSGQALDRTHACPHVAVDPWPPVVSPPAGKTGAGQPSTPLPRRGAGAPAPPAPAQTLDRGSRVSEPWPSRPHPRQEEEEGECAKRECSGLRMVPKALIFCVCLTGCLSSRGDQETRAVAGCAPPAVAGGPVGEEEVGGGRPAPRRTRHRWSHQGPPACEAVCSSHRWKQEPEPQSPAPRQPGRGRA